MESMSWWCGVWRMKLCKEKGKREETGDLAVLFDFFFIYLFWPGNEGTTDYGASEPAMRGSKIWENCTLGCHKRRVICIDEVNKQNKKLVSRWLETPLRLEFRNQYLMQILYRSKRMSLFGLFESFSHQLYLLRLGDRGSICAFHGTIWISHRVD